MCEHPIPVPPSSSRSRLLAAVPIFMWPLPLYYCTCIYRSAGTIQSHLPSWPTTVHRLCLHLMSLGRGPLHPTRVRFRRRHPIPSFVFPQAAPTNPLCWEASSPPGLYRSREHLRPAYPRRRPRSRDATRITHPCAERTAQPSHTVRRSRRPCRSLTRSRITRRQPWSRDIRLSAFRLFHPYVSRSNHPSRYPTHAG